MRRVSRHLVKMKHIKHLYLSGKSTEYIGRLYGHGNRTIARLLREMKIEIRPQPWEKTGKESPFFKGDRILSKGYWYVYLPEHHRADRRGRVLETIVLMEGMIGRHLTTYEIVHHIDNNTLNNSYSNLFLTNKRDHLYIHAFLRREKKGTCVAYHNRKRVSSKMQGRPSFLLRKNTGSEPMG